MLRADRVAEGLYFAEIYWMDGQPKRGTERSEVNNGVPHLGWGRCFVIDKDPAAKMVTLFCPYSFEGFQVTRGSYEYTSLRPPRHPYNAEWHADNFRNKWAQGVKNKWQLDFDTAVVVMKMLSLDVPTDLVPVESQKVSGGKEADDALGLTKPVKRKSRTGQILAYFWPTTKSIREAMADLSMTRSNVLSQLYLLQKNHGIGYKLQGDQAIISMPAGCEDPYDAPLEAAA